MIFKIKHLREIARTSSYSLTPRKHQPVTVPVRCVFDIHPTQYDTPYPKRLRLSYALKECWEIIPLFVVTSFSFILLAGSILWACKNKVDVVFTSRSRESLSRTMDLRNPSVHKLITINQRYEPWPEMQDALDKIREAEKRVMLRAQTCSHA